MLIEDIKAMSSLKNVKIFLDPSFVVNVFVTLKSVVCDTKICVVVFRSSLDRVSLWLYSMSILENKNAKSIIARVTSSKRD